MPSSHNRSRRETVSRTMSRLLRHGTRARGDSLAINLQDGGSVMISALLTHSALRPMHVTQSELMAITDEKDSDNKKRFEVEATHDDPIARCLQGHTLPVTRVNVVFNRPHQRYLIHATDSAAAAEILRSGMKQMKHRQEFHFVELNYDSRQSKYLINISHVRSKLIWLVLDTQLAASTGYSFGKLSNGVAVSVGCPDSQINRSVFAPAWLSDTQRVSINALLADEPRIVIIDHDASTRPSPKLLPYRSPDSDVSYHAKRPRSTVLSPPIPELSVSDYQHNSPTPSQLELPENERPPSWSPADVSPPPKKPRPYTPSSSAVTHDAISTPKPAAFVPPTPTATLQPGPAFFHPGFQANTAPQYVLSLPPVAPQLTPNQSTVDIQTFVDIDVSLEVDRRLAHLGNPPR